MIEKDQNSMKEMSLEIKKMTAPEKINFGGRHEKMKDPS